MLRAGCSVALLLSTGVVAATVLPPVEEFSKAWKKVVSPAKSGISELHALARKRPELADFAAWGEARILMGSDPSRAVHLLDSIAHLDGNPLAVVATEALVERRFLSSNRPDTSEIEALRAAVAGLVRSGMRGRLNRKLLIDAAAAGRFGLVDTLFRARLSDNPPIKEIREGLALLAPDTARLVSDEMRLSLAQAFLAADRADTSKALLDSIAARRPLVSIERILEGRIYLELGKATEAIAAFRKAAEDPREEQAFLWLAKGLERVGRTADAQLAQVEFARRWPSSAKAQEILWARGVDAERAGNCPQATELFERVKVGGGKRADWARFREGYCWFRMGDYARAEKIFAGEKPKASGTQRDAIWYFQARALELMEKDSVSKAEYAGLAASSPWSFHGHLARRRLGTDSVFSDSLRKAPMDTVHLVWPGAQPVALLKADSNAFVRYLCAQVVGQDWLVREFGKELDRAVGPSGARELALVLWMKKLGMERDATPRARRLLGRLPAEEISRLSKPVLRLFYPMPYLAEAKPLLVNDTILDAAFVHAVMRQESAYDRFARSPVGATGLLQLMPSTAKAIAKKVGMAGFHAEQLTDPAVNLKLGIAYMRDIARVWKGQLPLVLANYNAGPSPAMRWMDAFMTLPVEQAAEEITYWETRDYVKKCMANYWTYQLIYPEAKSK